MKVLLINVIWTGGSTGKIAYGFYRKLLENGHEAILAYGMGEDSRDDPNVRRIAPRLEPKIHFRYNLITGYHGTFGPVAHRRLVKLVENFKPDIVQLYNLHGYYMDIFRFMDYLGEKGIPTVYGMMDEYPYLGYCCYAYDCMQFTDGCEHCEFPYQDRYLKSLFFNRARKTVQMKKSNYDKFGKIVFTGPQWVVERAKQSYLLRDKDIRIVDEYVDTEQTFVVRDTAALRHELGIADEEIVFLDVAPSGDERKGVDIFISLAERLEHNKRCRFINVGYEGEYDGLPGNFIGIPYVRDQVKLSEYYSLADLFLCTSMADTMPNTCLDALACGTPICGFTITGIPYVAESPMGEFVEPGNVEELEKVVLHTEKKTPEMIDACRRYAEKRYSPETYFAKQMEIYEELL